MKKQQSTGIYLPHGGFMPFDQNKPSTQAVATRQRWGYQQFGMPLPNPDEVLRKLGKSIRTYKTIAAHPIVYGHLLRRKSAVVQLNRSFDEKNYHGSPQMLQACKDMIAGLPMASVIKEALGGAQFGYQPLEITWAERVVGGRTFFWPTAVEGKGAEFFHFDDTNQLRFLAQGVPHGELCAPNKFLLARNEPTYENPYGFPILAMCFWPVTFMWMGVKGWQSFINKYGMPMLIGKLPRSADDEDYDDLADKLWDMVEDSVAVLPDDGSVELLERKGGGADNLHENFLQYQRLELAFALLGQNQNSEKNSTHASASDGTTVTNAIRDMDRDIVLEPIQRLVQLFCFYNFGAEPKDCPVYQLTEDVPLNLEVAKRDTELTRQGAIFTPGYYYRTFSLLAGDLDEEAMAAQREAKHAPAAPARPDAAFSEGEPELEEDAEDLLQQAVAEYLVEQLPGISVALLQPALDAVMAQESADTVMDALIKALPNMNITPLRKLLERIMFAAYVVGEVMVQQELDDNG